MKKKILMGMILYGCLSMQAANAEKYGGYVYNDGGLIYSNVTLPKSLAKDVNFKKEEIVNISNLKPDLASLKKGVSLSTNVLGLVDIGDSGVLAAAKNGGISKVIYTETTYRKLFIPLIFIPIYVKETKTTIYGE